MKNKWNELIQSATKVREKAYAPHSQFKVGAAILGKSGKVYTGCNVENASYGGSICAERSALCNAIANGEKEIMTVVVVADTHPLTPPCGICRQFIQEFGPHCDVILSNLDGDIKEYNQRDLLPHPFDYSLVTKKKPTKK